MHTVPKLGVICLLSALGCGGGDEGDAPADQNSSAKSEGQQQAKAEAQPKQPQKPIKEASPKVDHNATGKHKFTNRLAKEKSPYLQQHKHNPVDWYPWGKEAFDKAKKENKPIFLSIGYSTCHWCHVMERESFEDEEVGKLLNKHFINVKLDREERPDIDNIYMTFVQATTGRGGWPLSVFLTPSKDPFFGATYFKKKDFMDLCSRINELWTNEERRKEIVNNAAQIREQLGNVTAKKPAADGKLQLGLIDATVETIKGTYDPLHGGFGPEPKFPRPSEPSLVLWQAARKKDKDGIGMVDQTCAEMADGGIYDQLGGGFARYSVDREWLVPHFEKMLYDNAQLIHLYLDAYLVTGKQRHADTVRDIIRYLLRDMTHKDGGWYSAEDADSEGHEGKFYCWTKKGLEEILEDDESEVVIRHYGITEKGNFEDHSHPMPIKQLNVLSIVDPDLSDAEKASLKSARAKMDAVRNKRVRPHLDDKILSSWNGLMLGAMARAYAVLGENDWLKAAEANYEFIQKELWDAKAKRMYHRWRDGERDSVQLLDAYAYQLDGTLHLYEATLKAKYLEQALVVADQMIELFGDKENGGFWQNAGDSELILRMKESHDGALPSANSVAALALLKLFKMTEQKKYREVARTTLMLFAGDPKTRGSSMPYMLQALDFYLHEPYRVVVAGKPGDPAFQKALRAAHNQYQPNRVILGNHGPVEPFAKKQTPAEDGSPLVYVCSGEACQIPTIDGPTIKEHLTLAPPVSVDLPAPKEDPDTEPEKE